MTSLQITLEDLQTLRQHRLDRLRKMFIKPLGLCRLQVTRRDPAGAYLDTVQQAQLGSTAPLKVWLDVGSLELLGDDGCTALSMQHRLRGDQFALHYTPGENADN